MSKQTGKNIDGQTIKGSLDLLDVFLFSTGADQVKRETIMYPLRIVQSLRSTGAAHRKGTEFDKALRRFDLVNLSNRAKIKKIVKDITNSFSSIAEIMRQ